MIQILYVNLVVNLGILIKTSKGFKNNLSSKCQDFSLRYLSFNLAPGSLCVAMQQTVAEIVHITR